MRKAEGRLPESVPVEVQFEHRISISKKFLSCVRKTRAYLVEHHIDVLVCANEMLAPVCALAVMGTGSCYIAWLHANIDVTTEYRFQGLCRRLAVKTASRIVVLTREMGERYISRYPKADVWVIGNPVDERLMRPVHYAGQSRKIISVGRLVAAKNYEQLIDVAEIVLKAHPEWSWDIYGDGRFRERLRKKIECVGLTERLRLMGEVDDVYDRYPDYAFLVMTSSYEGYPMVLLEGMACGLPLVAFDITTGPSYMIDHGKNGLLVPELSTPKMAEAVEKLIQNEEKRQAMSRASVEMRTRFSSDAVLARWREVLLGHAACDG